ncbi:MAG: hypothetical protein II208_03960, partial [Alphaproteobacteria bacterium]|nr:hypothetical protein [Alphaproteobacteria bacterium]
MISTKKLVFTVSLFALFMANSALANPATGDAVGTAHDVFDEYEPTNNDDGKNPGIAGVTYVNRAVNAAGNAAIKAEGHAASAGAAAISAANSAKAAAGSASDANETLKKAVKVSTIGTAVGSSTKSVYVDADGIVQEGITIPTGALASKSTITNADVASGAAIAQSKISGLTTALSGKQPKSTAAYQMGNASGEWTTMTTAQQNALNSGITSAKVSTYDAYASNKQDKLGYTAENSANKLKSTDTTTTISDTNKDTLYPTVGKVQAMLPTVNNATLTIQKNGTSVGTFTANSSEAKTINITVPTGALASKSTITSSDITDGTIVNADISDDAAIEASKIAGLAAVATSGSYTDLSNKPTIGSGILTIKRNGTSVGTFNANATAAAEINITDNDTKYTLPTATSDTLGGVKIGSNIGITEGKISVNTTATPASGSTVPLTAGGAYTALSGKQATISDLSTIRSGASAGATAVQPGTLAEELAKKQGVLTAGSNITIG